MNGVLNRLKLLTIKEKAQVPSLIISETLASQGSLVEDNTLKEKLLQSLEPVHTSILSLLQQLYNDFKFLFFFQKYLDKHFRDLFASPIMTSFFAFPGAYIVFLSRMSLCEMTTLWANHFIIWSILNYVFYDLFFHLVMM